jgi:hypothetical protein
LFPETILVSETCLADGLDVGEEIVVQSTSVIHSGVVRTANPTKKAGIWAAVVGSTALLLGLLLLTEQAFKVAVGNAWGFITLPFAVGLLVEAFQTHDQRYWKSITSIPFAIGTFMLMTLAFTIFAVDAGVVWPAYIVVAALPTLRS